MQKKPYSKTIKIFQKNSKAKWLKMKIWTEEDRKDILRRSESLTCPISRNKVDTDLNK